MTADRTMAEWAKIAESLKPPQSWYEEDDDVDAMTADTTSTPITAEGLRGLGFKSDEIRLWHMRWGTIRLDVWLYRPSPGETRWAVACGDASLGTAPDLETVADLIDVLKRMNGGGG